jgi:hypothetical protein
MKFPKCSTHQAAQWEPESIQRGSDRKPHNFVSSRCVHCGRPVVAFPQEFPQELRVDVKRHTAWHYLDKEGEHAGNVSVLPWESESFADFMHRTVNETLQ